MASPQPPPGPSGNGNGNGPADKQQSTRSDVAQPVVEILGGDAYAAVIVCALLLLNMTSGMGEAVCLGYSLLQLRATLRVDVCGHNRRLCLQQCAVCCSLHEWWMHVLTARMCSAALGICVQT